MQKVKVHRYVSGKRPDYAPRSSSEEESEDEEFIAPTKLNKQNDEDDEFPDDNYAPQGDFTEVEKLDPRLKRLMQSTSSRRFIFSHLLHFICYTALEGSTNLNCIILSLEFMLPRF